MPLVLFDSNILIDNLEGHAAAVIEIMNYQDAIISSISWVEIACKMDHAALQGFKAFLTSVGIRVVHPDDDIMERAAVIRGRSLLVPPKLPLIDCIIRATAEANGRLVITRNPADFGGEGPLVRVPYEIANGVAVNIKPPLP
jgi:predicted nucleic acid-binding protein